GPGALKEGQGATLAMASAFQRPATETESAWNGFNVVHTAAARMGGLMLGYARKGGIADIVAAAPKLTFFLGADEVDFSAF
ncbi:NADH-quinone oxidoreductase subunit G, partial [Escherichia coli]|nr:NADH-quinone oxidoreductase subunit G [Escherichia coli]